MKPFVNPKHLEKASLFCLFKKSLNGHVSTVCSGDFTSYWITKPTMWPLIQAKLINGLQFWDIKFYLRGLRCKSPRKTNEFWLRFCMPATQRYRKNDKWDQRDKVNLNSFHLFAKFLTHPVNHGHDAVNCIVYRTKKRQKSLCRILAQYTDAREFLTNRWKISENENNAFEKTQIF